MNVMRSEEMAGAAPQGESYRVTDRPGAFQFGGSGGVITFQSEINALGRLTAAWGDLETGGVLYGLWTFGLMLVVFLAIGCGQLAIHRRSYFENEPEFVMQTNTAIWERFGLQHVGDWHSHHHLGIDHPSSGDVHQVQSITTKNYAPRWVGIITTTHVPSAATKIHVPSWWPLRQAEVPDVRINAFMFPDPQTGRYVRVPVRVLPGVSPVRLAIRLSGMLEPWTIGDDAEQVPVGRIHCDLPVEQTASSAQADAVLNAIAEQIRELPAEIQSRVRLATTGSLVTVLVPLDEHRTVHLHIDQHCPDRVEAADLEYLETRRIQDVTTAVTDRRRSVRILDVFRVLQVRPTARRWNRRVGSYPVLSLGRRRVGLRRRRIR